MNRRGFLRATAAGLGTLAASSGVPELLRANPYGLPVGLQVYTVRDQLAKDPIGTLKKVAEVGYKEIEVGDFLGKTAAEYGALMSEVNLTTPSAHYGFETLASGWEKEIEFAKAAGLKYMVVAALAEDHRKSLDGFKRAAAAFNRAGEQTAKAGIQFAYHNHNFEFNKFDGTLGYDVLVKETNPKLVHFELDCFWMTHAGHDPVQYFKAYPGRFPLLHIKDLKKGIPASTSFANTYGNPFTEVGRGVINWKRIFEAAKGGGLKHYFVEQDECDDPPFEAIKISYDYLKNLTV